MPARSKAQFKFMGMVASGKIKRKDLSMQKAHDYMTGVRYSSLPARKRRK